MCHSGVQIQYSDWLVADRAVIIISLQRDGSVGVGLLHIEAHVLYHFHMGSS